MKVKGMVGLVNINTETGKFYDVAKKLWEIKEVKEIWGAYGDIDLIAKVETGEEYLSDVVIKKIQSIDGIIKTSTTVLIPIKEPK
jgi:DNA-binding Lrp family transcriptional regulator